VRKGGIMPRKKVDTNAPTAADHGSAPLPFPVVAIGASAGGLEALEVLLKGLPDKPGAAFVVISHMDPAHKSFLAEILGSYTVLPARQAVHGMQLEADTVSVIPPGKIMRIAGGRLQLAERTDAKGNHHPIDLFFTSLARDQGDNALCIILSGTGADGSEGLRAIKEADGLALVQSAETASHPGMPESAAETGLADAVLPIEDIPVQLDRYLRSVLSVGRQLPSRAKKEGHLRLMQKLLALIQAESGHDLSGYKLNTISRRIHKRMLLLGSKSLKDYVDFVETDRNERSDLLHEILIRVTRFFRDADAFETLRRQVLIPLLQRKNPADFLRIWVAGCATGEEAYTLAMLVSEYLEVSRRKCGVKIFATDIDEASIASARHGVFRGAVAKDVPPKLLAKYFSAKGADYIVSPALREMILFAPHDILRDPPFFRMDLIVCRNLLIYLGGEAQNKVLSLFHATLGEGGSLFLGPSETVGEQSGLFEAVDKRWRIFRRRDTGQRPPRFPVRSPWPVGEFPFFRPAERLPTPKDSAPLVDRALAARYGRPSVLVDAEMRIVRIQGDVSRYLGIPQGDLTNSLYMYARKALRLQLRSAVKNAVETRQPVEMRNLRLSATDESLVSLIVEPLDHLESGAGLLLVVFEETSLPGTAEGHAIAAAVCESEVVSQLEEELKTTRDQLQEAIESFEGMNEELRASNEELMSMNEEIQSSYEELETSGEELQALNEELTVMNTELQTKVEELDAANSYLDNLLKSTNVATVFLDREMGILRYTPAASDLFHLRAADVRRPITEIVNQVRNLDIPAVGRSVLSTLQMAEREVETNDGRWFLARIFPYQTVKQEVDGVVLTFVDVTPLKLAEAQLKLLNQELEQRVEERTRELNLAKNEAERRAAELQAVMDQVPAAVWITRDRESRQAIGNRAGCRLLRMAPEDCHSGAAFDTEGLPGCRALKDGRELAPSELPLARAGAGEAVVGEELDLVFADGETRTILGNATPLLDPHGNIFGAVGSFLDITERKLAEAALKESEERFRTLVESAPEAIFVQTRGRFAYVNPAAARLLCGGNPEDLFGTPVADCFHADVADLVRERIRRLNEERVPVPLAEVQYLRRDGSPLDVDVSGVPIVYGGVNGALVFMRDITERKQAEAARRESEEIYRGLFLNEHTAMFLIDPASGAIMDANPAACAYYGYSREEFMAMTVGQLNTLPPEEIRKKMAAAEGREQNRFEFQHRLASGELREIEVYSGPVRVKGRQLLYSLVHDITDRKRAENALKASEARLRLAQEAAKAGTWEWELGTNTNIWSNELWKLYGLEPECCEPSYETWLQVIAPEDRPAAAAAVQDAASHGAELSAEWRVNDPGGPERWLLSRGQPRRDAEGRVVSYLGIVMDITERKLAEAEQRQLAAQRQLALDAAGMGWWHYDPLTRVSTWDERYAEIFGVTGSESPNDDILKRLHPDDLPGVWAKVEAALDPDEPKDYEAQYRITLPDGRMRWVEAHGLALFEGQGRNRRATSLVGTVADVTERKMAEQEIRSLAKFPGENPNPVMRVSPELVVLFANQASREFLDHFGSAVGQIFPGPFSAALEQALATRKVQSFEADVDGKVLAMAATPIADESYVNIYGLDITARREAEKAREKYLAELKSQREFLGSLIDNAPIAVGVVEGPEHRFILTNPAYEGILPERDTPIVDRTLQEVFPAVAGHVATLFDEVYATGRTMRLREYQVPIGSRITWWDADYVPLHDETGRVLRILILGQDITGRVHAVQALRENEEKFRNVADYTYDWEYWRAPDGSLIWISPSCESHTGYTADEFMSDPGLFRRITLPEDTPVLEAHARELAQGEARPHGIDFRIRHRSGRTVWINHHCVKIERPDGTSLGRRASNRNITDRKLAEEALKESEERFRTLFDSMQEGVALHRMVYDEQGQPREYVILDVNPAFERIMGLSRESVVGKTSTNAYGVDAPPFLEAYASVAAGEGSRYFEVHFAPLDRTFSISAVSPGPGLFATVFENITERTRTQAELRQAKEAAEAANRAKGEFLANMSHELRTPLNGVLGMLQLLADMPLNEDQMLLLQTALESGRGLKAIINDILSFAQIEAGRISISREECDLRDILGSVCRAFGYEAKAKGLELACDIEASVPQTLLSDVVRIRQILVNLLGNSLKFTEQGRVAAHVTCLPQSSARDETLLLISVSDTGIGIADDKITTIFEPFTQADGSLKRKYQGTGIGLSIVRLLVGLMGGSICVESQTGAGSTFHFTLRCGLPQAAEAAPCAQGAILAADLTGLKVLLAEDDRVNRFATTRFLERLGCRVTTAANGRQALELVATGDFDCVIMDIQMPEMNGLEATRAIRAATNLGAKSRVPILAMTAHAMSGDREQFLAAGMDGYIAKPVELDKLRQALARVVGAARGTQGK
jgi:PAS domain S-box-containing protein